MRRTDRLFEIIQLFRGGHLILGRDIAAKLEVSLRTIYRDIDTLIASGVPIEGERGVGYILREPIFLPPLTLTTTELEALHLGMEVVRQTADAELANAAERLVNKVNAVLPSDRKGQPHLKHISIYATQTPPMLDYLAMIRAAIAERRVLQLSYTSLAENTTNRRIWPLQAEYWGQVWTCTAWCEARQDFRAFRIDRIKTCHKTSDYYRNEPGKTYADYLTQFTSDGAVN